MKTELCLLIFIIGMFVWSCGPGERRGSEEKDEVEELKTEVIAIHDEVMPKMGQLRDYQKQLSAKAEELEAQAAESYLQAAIACEKAYEGMFEWMRQFDSTLEGMSEEEAMGYLEEQREKVVIVNEDIKEALKEAEVLLEEGDGVIK
ncbi:hypothetical protein [Pleomorphovibrio marinus]|uniref:hypothetical protein n=1 Tax=Pleomorphovibrio marinus TaxID=2164132 RepID=UPI001E3D1E79|nr:hypothetical protein [Pleomorphovibrio marinus]